MSDGGGKWKNEEGGGGRLQPRCPSRWGSRYPVIRGNWRKGALAEKVIGGEEMGPVRAMKNPQPRPGGL